MFTICPKEKQIPGSFNGGAIQERRLVIPHHGKPVAPISNLFYWAHAWSEKGSLLGEHPHEAFEILTFVLEGEIEHFDSHSNDWKKLSAGDVQIIRAGSGLSHAERFFPGSHIFQIWFDPELQSAMMRAPSYNDYAKSTFPILSFSGGKETIFRGDTAPLDMNTEGALIKEYTLELGKHRLALEEHFDGVGFLRKGKASINEKVLNAEDGFRVLGETSLNLEVTEPCKLFLIQVPTQLSYLSYAKQAGMN